VARLRRWLLAGVVLLLVALAALIGITRWKQRKFFHDLPAKLGIDIRNQANGFTWSQSVKGRTLFTLHAAKAIQRKNGRTTLHDVAITLYGPPGSNTTDSISGAQFEYDQPNGVATAAGEVHLDLAAPTNTQDAVASAANGKRIMVTTSGLSFLQKDGVATTDQPLRMLYGDLHGTATGADYNTDTQILRLHSAVQMDGTQSGQAIHLTASAAEFNRSTRMATLRAGVLHSGTSIASGDTVVLDAGSSGGIDVIRMDGHATIQTPDGMKVQAPKLVAHINAAGKPTEATMTGGVTISGTGCNGHADTAILHFNAAGIAQLAELSGTVSLDEQSESSHSHLIAQKVVAQLAQDSQRHVILQSAIATGHAEMHSTTLANPAKTTVVRGDSLHAILSQSGSKRYVSSLTGTGSTVLESDDGDGNFRTSSGDTLDIKLLPPGQGKQNSSVQTAVQTGHVIVLAEDAAKDGKATQTRATAGHAEFQNATGNLVLTISPVVTGDGMQVAADRITLTQGSNSADARGAVRGVYQSSDKPGSEPVHVLADHATIASAITKFFGTQRPARMWTSTAQMEAPVIELDRSTNHLLAHGAANASATAPSVHLLLPVSSINPAKTNAAKTPGTAASGKAGATGTDSTSKTNSITRLQGATLLYIPAEGNKLAHADLSGNVRIEQNGTVMTARQAIATLNVTEKNPNKNNADQNETASNTTTGNLQTRNNETSNIETKNKRNSTSSNLMSGSVQQIVATGQVHLNQPGRSGTGERLVYTADDQRYVLTGTPQSPPRVVDSRKGMLTGTTLIVHAPDQSVEVEGQGQQRVHTEIESTIK